MIIAMAICNVNCKLYKHNSSIHILKTDAFVIYTQNPGKTDRVSWWHGKMEGQQIRQK